MHQPIEPIPIDHKLQHTRNILTGALISRGFTLMQACEIANQITVN